jgi:large subunit ribosomal protein L15
MHIMSMIHDITSVTPRNQKPTRKGRGESSGHGKTSGRGTKGAKARQGTYIKRGHEGGQTLTFRRFPKRGFSNHDFARRFHIVNVSELNAFDDGTVVDAVALREKGLVPDEKQSVKILGQGELSKKLTVVAGWYSQSAHAKIVAAGGTAQNPRGEAFAFPKPKKKFIPREPVKKSKPAAEPEGEAKAKADAKAEPKAELKVEAKAEAPAEAKAEADKPAAE